MLKVQTPNGEDKVLLHSCCAPCSSAIIECMLENGIRPTVFYCNPNISSIYIPASVTTIGEEAFIYYNNLATVRYGGSQSQWSAVSVGTNAFPDGVRYVYNVN